MTPRNASDMLTKGCILAVLVLCVPVFGHIANDVRMDDSTSHRVQASVSSVSSGSSDEMSDANDQRAKIPHLPITASPALLVIDVQNCFLPGGAIPVEGGYDIIPVINEIRQSYNFRMIAFSKDWHCPNHISFETQHPDSQSPVLLSYVNQTKTEPKLCHTEGSGIFQPTVDCPDIEENPTHYLSFNQSLWPPHCVVNTEGANLASSLHFDAGADVVIKKGTLCQIDSYSAFEDNGGLQKTDLNTHLSEMQVDTVLVAGLTLDYCVKFTALDAKKYGYTTFVILDASKATSDKKVPGIIEELQSAGVHVITSTDLKHIGLRKQAPKILSLIFAVPMVIIGLLLMFALVKFIRSPNVPHIGDETASATEGEDRKPLLLD